MRYLVVVRRDWYDPRLVHSSMRGAYWLGPGLGTRTRIMADAWTDVTGCDPNESLGAALRDLAASVTDRWA